VIIAEYDAILGQWEHKNFYNHLSVIILKGINSKWIVSPITIYKVIKTEAETKVNQNVIHVSCTKQSLHIFVCKNMPVINIEIKNGCYNPSSYWMLR